MTLLNSPWCRWRLLLPLLAGLSLVAPAAAGPLEAAALAEARAWLTRIQDAARSANYQGTMVFSSAAGLSSSRVWRFGVGDQTYERLEALDGRQHQMVRHNDLVHTLWPQSRVAVVEKRETLAAWGTTPQAVDPQALDQYKLRREGLARIAGRDAVVLLMEPQDTLRYSQRLWADLATGLMLRADILGPNPLPDAPVARGDGPPRGVIESTAFSEIDIGVKPQPEAVLGATRKLEGYRFVRHQQKRTTLLDQGWELARPVPGFSLAGCVQRGMHTGSEPAPVLQSVFSDGLTHVSVFVEPFNAQIHPGEMRAQQGATATLMSRRGDHWFTVVGDVPPSTLVLFVDALERRRP